jgi:hypothetical protein
MLENEGKLRFILLAESTIVTLNAEKKWVGWCLMTVDVMNFILCIPRV